MYRRSSNYSEYVQSPGVRVSRDEADILQVQLSRRRCGNGSGRGNRDQFNIPYEQLLTCALYRSSLVQ
jgi:hypothetical protein